MPDKSLFVLTPEIMKGILSKNKKFRKLADDVADIANYLWLKGWAERNAGNISVNVNHMVPGSIENPNTCMTIPLPAPFAELAGMYFYVTGTGKRMRDLSKKPLQNSVLIRIDNDGNAFSMIPFSDSQQTEIQPTSELPTHLGIHQMIAQRQSNEKVVIHTHATELIALTHSPEFRSEKAISRLLWGMHPETIVLVPKGVGFVPYTLPGTSEIAIPTIHELQRHDVVIWEKHGVFAIGHTVSGTFDTIDIVCKSAKIWFLCKSAGFDPEGLSDEQLIDLKGLTGNFDVIS
jgi:rhamnulose-1-phosphate aldolase